MTAIIKIILIGPKGVGKTSILNRYIDNVFYQETEFSTIGVDVKFKNFTINNKDYRLQLWDTAGQECFFPIIKPYFNEAACVIYCFSLQNKMSFFELDEMIKKYNYLDSSNNKIKILVGTCADNNNYNVTDSMISNLMEKYDIKYYYDISSVTNHTVDFMIDHVINMITNSNIKLKRIDVSSKTNHSKKRISHTNFYKLSTCCVII